MPQITDEKLEILKEAYLHKQFIEDLQISLSKYEIKELRQLIKKHISDGYTNYLRLVSVYSCERDALLNIYVRHLYENLKITNKENENYD